MTVVKEPTCISSQVEELVCSFVPAAKQVTDVGAELSFILPSAATAKFPELFDSLDGMYETSLVTVCHSSHFHTHTHAHACMYTHTSNRTQG